MNKKPRLSSLSFLGFVVNSAMESADREIISFNDVYSGLSGGTLIDDLERRLPDAMDLSLFGPDSGERTALLEALQMATGGIEGRERRKVGVERSGLALLMALVLEAMQQGYWFQPAR